MALTRTTLTAIPKSFWSADYTILRGDEPVAELDLSHWREGGSMTVEGHSMRIYKQGVTEQKFVLELDGRPLVQAAKPSIWRSRFELRLGDAVCEVRRGSIWKQTFHVWQGEEQIGEVAREGWFTQRTRISLPEEWPTALQIFVFWLALVIWKRDEEAG